jgi:hypothetical protein
VDQDHVFYLVDIAEACDTHSGCVVSMHRSEARAKEARARLINKTNTHHEHPAWQRLRIAKMRRISKVGPGQLLPVVHDPGAATQWF